jgi:hypothetical protein
VTDTFGVLTFLRAAVVRSRREGYVRPMVALADLAA